MRPYFILNQLIIAKNVGILSQKIYVLSILD